MIRLVSTLTITAVALLSSLPSCTRSADREGALNLSPPVRVTADAPYLCDLIPEGSFRNATGVRFRLSTRWTGVTSSHGVCVAHASGQDAPLGIDWSFTDGNELLAQQEQNFAKFPHKILPGNLGRGFAAWDTQFLSTRSNYVVALFKCGKKQPWLKIEFVPVVQGRDPSQDMIDFMRIAQRRFKQLHKCDSHH